MIKQNPCLISTIRQPLRTFFLILLLGLISFAFIGKAVEYLVVQRETNRLGSYYHSIGSLRKIGNSQDWDVSLGANFIKTSPYLAYEDRRRWSSGVMEGVYNSYISGLDSENSGPNADLVKGIYTDNFWFYGVLESKKEIIQSEGINSGKAGYVLSFNVDKVVAGYPEFIKNGQLINLLFLFKDHESATPLIEAMEERQLYFVRGWFDTYFNPGPEWRDENSKLQITPLDGENIWYLPVAQNTELNFNNPDLAYIKNEFEVASQNQHTLSIITTTDMSTMPDTQPSSHLYYLVDGRWLNHEDDTQGNKVIVIQEGLSQQRELKIGDMITIVFHALKNPDWHGYIVSDEDRQNWFTVPNYKESFEIVGIFGSTVGTSYNFIPNSTLPAGFEVNYGGLDYSFYSFVLDSYQNQNAFINENQDKLAQLGIGLSFVDNNAKNYWAGVIQLRQSASASVLIFGGVLLIALILTVFLYITQHIRDYAILRALGISITSANQQMLLPIALIGTVGILFGGIFSWQYALEKAAVSLSTLPTPAGQVPSANLNLGYLFALCIGILALLLVFSWVGTALIARRPVLELLQGENIQTGKRKKKKQFLEQFSSSNPLSASTITLPVSPFFKQLNNAASDKKGRISAQRCQKNETLMRFILRSIFRSSLKSILILVVASGFIFALVWMQLSIEKNRTEVDQLYKTTTVKAEIVQKNAGVETNFGSADITGDTIEKILKSGFVKSAYLEAPARIVHISGSNGTTKSTDVSLQVCGINQPETYFSVTLHGAVVEYASGWDEGLFTKMWTLDEVNKSGVPAVFPEDLFKQYKLKMGETLSLTDFQGQTYKYIVSGEYFFGTIGYSESRIMLPLSALKEMEGRALLYNVARFDIDPAKNRELTAFKSKMDQMLARSSAGLLPLQIVLWDEELRAVVTPLEKALSLLRILYPVTLAISALIGAGLNLLLILQMTKEAALLRALGVSKVKVQIMLSVEHLLLSLIGVAMGLVVLVLTQPDMSALFARSTLIAAGLYLVSVLLGSMSGAVFITMHNPMEMLQVKE